MLKKPTLNVTDYALIAVTVLAALAIHQKFVAPKLAPKVTAK